MSMVNPESARARFEKFVEVVPPCDCVVWIGGVGGTSLYGRFWFDGKKIEAHRFSYWLARGRKPPAFLDVHHRCGNSLCVNPEHLELRTPEVNQRFRRRNVCWCGDRRVWVAGRMRCRRCHRERMQRCREREREAEELWDRY